MKEEKKELSVEKQVHKVMKEKGYKTFDVNGTIVLETAKEMGVVLHENRLYELQEADRIADRFIP